MAFFLCTALAFVALAAAASSSRGGAARAGRFLAPGYPATPAAFVLFLGAVIACLRLARPRQAAAGFALVLAGVPVYHILLAARGARQDRDGWRRAMTWIKTIPPSEADEKLRDALDASARSTRRSTPCRPASPTRPAHRRLALAHPRRALPRVRDLRRPDVARPAADAPAARDDHDGRLGHEPLPLLNRVSRRVSASGDPGRGAGRGDPRDYRTAPIDEQDRVDARLRRPADEGRDAHHAASTMRGCAPSASTTGASCRSR